MLPETDPVLILTVNVSADSTRTSVAADIESEPAFDVIVNDPLTALKSASTVVVLLIVQYSVVPFATLVVLTLNVPLAPSLILAGIEPNAYVGVGLRLVSLTVTEPLVATMLPETDPVLILTVNVSAPSVVASATGLMVNEPAFDVIVNDPLTALKSAFDVVALLRVQYSVVPFATLVVLTLKVPLAPSLILAGIEPNAYVGVGVRLVSLTVTELLVATMPPETDPVLILTVNVSAPSVVASATGLILNEPAFDVIVNDPLTALKSASTVVVLLRVQYNVVPFATLVVLTLKVPLAPSLILAGIEPNAYVGVVSVAVTVLLTATTGPVIDPVLMLTAKLSVDSTRTSVAADIENEPAFDVIVNDPLTALKSSFVVVRLSIVQYSVVPSAMFAVLTLNVPLAPSLILEGIELNA
jgi:hypothetical protein